MPFGFLGKFLIGVGVIPIIGYSQKLLISIVGRRKNLAWVIQGRVEKCRIIYSSYLKL